MCLYLDHYSVIRKILCVNLCKIEPISLKRQTAKFSWEEDNACFHYISLLLPFFQNDCRAFLCIFIVLSRCHGFKKRWCFNFCCFACASSRSYAIESQEIRGNFFADQLQSRTCCLLEGEISRTIEFEHSRWPNNTETLKRKLKTKPTYFCN